MNIRRIVVHLEPETDEDRTLVGSGSREIVVEGPKITFPGGHVFPRDVKLVLRLLEIVKDYNPGASK